MTNIKYWEKDCLELDGILTFDSNNFKCSIENYSQDEYVLELKGLDHIGLELRLTIFKVLPLNTIREITERIACLDKVVLNTPPILSVTVFEILREYEKELEEC
ncbi:hypothetical protein HZY83_07730 [Gemella sp. GH3]|uniref:hypothetical protein n=1 Tax=unclassified Gemella TaxID=2624949 RepID=UPI0015D09026|nr:MULTISPECIES: hypothetical protein [unclassified Gemella]MBF0714563.1 hypothetical protein [Gemella sp. GH3.1]NYS51515.1 hypothetical protein [Gemella sp. GH3]